MYVNIMYSMHIPAAVVYNLCEMLASQSVNQSASFCLLLVSILHYLVSVPLMKAFTMWSATSGWSRGTVQQVGMWYALAYIGTVIS